MASAPYGRWIAIVYLIAWPVWVASLIGIWASDSALWSIIVFGGGAGGLVLCAESTASPTGHPLGGAGTRDRFVWQCRFASGIELWRAWGVGRT